MSLNVHARIVTNIVTTPTDANDARTPKKARLLTPTDADRRNYSPPEPKGVGSSRLGYFLYLMETAQTAPTQDQCVHGSRPNCKVDGVGGLGNVTSIREAPPQPLSVENPRRTVDRGERSFRAPSPLTPGSARALLVPI